MSSARVDILAFARRLRGHGLSIAVWLLGVAAVAWLCVHRGAQAEFVGIAWSESRAVAALTPGRLLALLVRPFDAVQRGDTVAVLEDDRIQAALATATAENGRLKAELAAAEERLASEARVQESDRLADVRRFATDMERTRVQKLEAQLTLQTDRILLHRLQFELDRATKLATQDAVAAAELEKAQTEQAAMVSKIAEHERLLAQLELDLDAASNRQEAYLRECPTAPSLTKLLEPLRAAIMVQELRMAELAHERSLLVLRSPTDGVVAEVFRRNGETVLPGQAIITVTTPEPLEVVVYVDADTRSKVGLGKLVELSVARRGSSKVRMQARIGSIGPTAEQLPVRLWRNPNVAEWGWPVRITVTAPLTVFAGELVGVRGL
jgi:multidrug resistance efflux pump